MLRKPAGREGPQRQAQNCDGGRTLETRIGRRQLWYPSVSVAFAICVLSADDNRAQVSNG